MSEAPENNVDQKEWYREAEEALERAGAALKGAWEASRDARMSALETAKKAAQQLGDALERGVAGAKDQWAGSQTDSDDGSSQTEEE